ncbi:MAG: hypothetical protein DI622_10455 [Chryseobacterium sp.]|uniref:hypothetical protein n=1 Tax=Chryseobacterium sp. TaxID=1871047 RepID=UPI000DAFA15E|nr:hypothetical protein [Chryseobacterium sp.]MPS63353.1 hypothetical protein [Chryseobacterium sp.]PZU17787.1 MAG: hypothetical protein DI622_10455 [Chryseobacterium sp.]
MKKLLFLIPIILFSCKKEVKSTEIKMSDSVSVKEKSENKADSVIKKENAKSADTIAEVNSPVIVEEKNGRVIIKTVEGNHFPILIQEEFTKDQDKLILKISGYSKPQLKAKILTKQSDFNIRFNQIKLPDGKMDGPFGREITYDIPEKGEVWLIIGKNNMADGQITGAFSVKVE